MKRINRPNLYIDTKRKTFDQKKERLGFDPPTLGVAIFCADHSTTPLPLNVAYQVVLQEMFDVKILDYYLWTEFLIVEGILLKVEFWGK